jgi:hypothetical protein
LNRSVTGRDPNPALTGARALRAEQRRVVRRRRAVAAGCFVLLAAAVTATGVLVSQELQLGARGPGPAPIPATVPATVPVGTAATACPAPHVLDNGHCVAPAPLLPTPPPTTTTVPLAAPIAVAVPAGATPGPTPGSFVVTVTPGETLSGISAWFTTNGYQAIFAANEAELGPNPNLIRPGEQIVVTPALQTMSVIPVIPAQ